MNRTGPAQLRIIQVTQAFTKKYGKYVTARASSNRQLESFFQVLM